MYDFLFPTCPSLEIKQSSLNCILSNHFRKHSMKMNKSCLQLKLGNNWNATSPIQKSDCNNDTALDSQKGVSTVHASADKTCLWVTHTSFLFFWFTLDWLLTSCLIAFFLNLSCWYPYIITYLCILSPENNSWEFADV